MNIFKSMTLTWKQIGAFKLCLLSLGIMVGAYFSAFFLQWMVALAVIFVVTAVYIVSVWWKQ